MLATLVCSENVKKIAIFSTLFTFVRFMSQLEIFYCLGTQRTNIYIYKIFNIGPTLVPGVF